MLALKGKTILITGANTGLGKETARQLLLKGARILMACRNVKKGEEAARDLEVQVGGNCDLDIIALDLSSLTSIRECSSQLVHNNQSIHVLINNAGVMACPFSLTKDGLEMQFGVNHVGHFLLTNLLLPSILRSVPARIITVSSHAHYLGRINLNDLSHQSTSSCYNPFIAYAQSKLANVLFNKQLARNLRDTGVTCYAVHPGVVATELGRHMNKNDPQKRSLSRRIISQLSKTPQQGAETSVYCASNEQLITHSGYYYSNCHRTLTSPLAWGNHLSQKLWNETEKLVKEFSHPV